MKLSLMDAMVLNSTRSPGESQSQSVARRMHNFQGEQWESLWREATKSPDKPGAQVTRPEERDKRIAARVQGLARAGQAGKAARAAHLTKPAVRDPAREGELKALFPPALGTGDARPPPGRPERALPPEWQGEQGEARLKQLVGIIEGMVRSPNRRSRSRVRLPKRLEHLEIPKYTEGGVQRMARLLVSLALGQEPTAVTGAHATGEVIATGSPMVGSDRLS
jgi:hypothetical protein